jgi:ferric-dicitrate binding protein FerR (iron transport regulator)
MNERTDDTMDGETGLERRARERLLDSAEHLDGRTRSRLTQARHAALAELPRGRTFRTPGFWLPAGALAGAAMLAVMVWVGQPGSPGAPALATDAGAVEDLAILASADGPELYADDPEFYEWAGSAVAVEATRG